MYICRWCRRHFEDDYACDLHETVCASKPEESAPSRLPLHKEVFEHIDKSLHLVCEQCPMEIRIAALEKKLAALLPLERRGAARFVIPTIEEIDAKIKEMGYKIDAESFYHHYNTFGWAVNGKPMKCWSSALVTWYKRSGEHPVRRGPGLFDVINQDPRPAYPENIDPATPEGKAKHAEWTKAKEAWLTRHPEAVNAAYRV